MQTERNDAIANDWRQKCATIRNSVRAELTRLGVTYAAVFVPQSASRHAGLKEKSLNWRVTFTRAGRVLGPVDYMQGIGHVPGFEHNLPRTLYFERLRNEYEAASETGKYPHEPLQTHTHEHGTRLDVRMSYKLLPLPAPDSVDVLQSLFMDATDETFENWCAECGYDPDSRKAERIYQECVQIRAKLQKMFSRDELDTLRELTQEL